MVDCKSIGKPSLVRIQPNSLNLFIFSRKNAIIDLKLKPIKSKLKIISILLIKFIILSLLNYHKFLKINSIDLYFFNSISFFYKN